MSNENFLKSLLINGHDRIAAEYGHIHRKAGHAGIELMQFALDNENELFLKLALKKQGVFENDLLIHNNMINIIKKTLIDGTKTELILNVCLYTDFASWKRSDIEKFMEFLNGAIDPEVEQNLMYKCYNPILVICLSCIFLAEIGDAISEKQHECHELISSLADLGEQIICNIEETDKNEIHRIFMDVDFLDRTVIKLITSNELAALLKDQKVFALIDELWVGK